MCVHCNIKSLMTNAYTIDQLKLDLNNNNITHNFNDN